MNTEEIREKAQEAFWKVVADAHPEIKTGDMAPHDVWTFDRACDDAIETWVEGNRELTPEEIEKRELKEFLENEDGGDYDIEMALTDLENNNFQNKEQIEEYRHKNIVCMSWLNGQRKQAQQQANRYGLTIQECLYSQEIPMPEELV